MASAWSPPVPIRTARIWNAHTGEPLSPPLKHEGIVCAAHFGADGGRVVTVSFDKTARLWDSFSGEPLGKPMWHKAIVRNARFSPQGQRVVTASEDGTARIWDAASGDPASEPMVHRGSVWSAEFDPAGKSILTASADATAQIWDARPGQALHHSITGLAAYGAALWSPDGREILTASAGLVKLFDTTWGIQWVNGASYPERPESASVRFSPDSGAFVTAGSDGTARIWPARYEPHEQAHLLAGYGDTSRWPFGPPAQLGTLPLRHQGSVHYAEFSLDNARVVTASADGSAQVWSAATGAPRARH